MLDPKDFFFMNQSNILIERKKERKQRKIRKKEIIQNFSKYNFIFTDGSKDKLGVESAFWIPSTSISSFISPPPFTSIFHAQSSHFRTTQLHSTSIPHYFKFALRSAIYFNLHTSSKNPPYLFQ